MQSLNQNFAKIGRLPFLLVCNYADPHLYVTKMRCLSNDTFKVTADAFIAFESKNWYLKTGRRQCWLCVFEKQHLLAILQAFEFITLEVG